MQGLVWWSASPAALTMVYFVARHHTAGIAAAAAGVVAGASAVVASAVGWSDREVLGAALVAAGMAAVAWALGRWRRRSLTRRTAAVIHWGARSRFAHFAARLERHRLAAGLHDTSAHRFTAIAVGSTAALRLADPVMKARALDHAAAEGRAAASELARLAGCDDPPEPAATGDLSEIDALMSTWPPQRITYRRTAGATDASPQATAVAVRVVRESLTNAFKHAPASSIDVSVETKSAHLVATITDHAPPLESPPPIPGPGTGGERGDRSDGVEAHGGQAHGETEHRGQGHTGRQRAAQGRGGWGLAGLAGAVGECGGSLTAGPSGAGWTVRAVLPLTPGLGLPASTRVGGWRGRRATDLALVMLAVALTAGVALLPPENPPLTPAQALMLVPLFALHALPLAWRHRAPAVSLAASVAVYPLLLAVWRTTGALQPPGNLYLLCGWVELVLLYAVGVRRRARTWPLPLALFAASGVLLGALAVLPAAAWALGIVVGTRREQRRKAAVARDARFAAQTHAALLAERERIAAGLRSTVLRRADEVVAAADEGRLDAVLAAARAGLTGLRELLDGLGAQDDVDPPPTLEALGVLGTRRSVFVRYEGHRRAVHPAVEVIAFLAGRELMRRAAGQEATVTVTYLRSGMMVSGTADDVTRRRLLALADAAGGEVSANGAAVRVWLPEAGLA
ncbi:ATP-binding protein [Spongiactinospora sp. 9N601]|uniref:ATP-binding protein n=1 Tax=Spongiactinospora sp. 9N601 TaxID=3375149 RepID=UPI003794FF6F